MTAGAYESDVDGLLVVRALCHELRTPVASLAALTRELARTLSAGGSAEIAALAEAQARLLQGLLGGAHDLLASEDGVDPARPLVPVREVVAGALHCADVDRARVDLSVGRVAGGVQVEGLRTQRVLTNLLDNAERHGPRHARIALRARVRGNRVRLAVRDGGRVTPGLLDGLARRDPPPGWVGLGLWMVRQLVAAMGGTIRARDLGLRGLEVEVSLPAVRAGGATGTTASLARPGREPGPAAPR